MATYYRQPGLDAAMMNAYDTKAKAALGRGAAQSGLYDMLGKVMTDQTAREDKRAKEKLVADAVIENQRRWDIQNQRVKEALALEKTEKKAYSDVARNILGIDPTKLGKPTDNLADIQAAEAKRQSLVNLAGTQLPKAVGIGEEYAGNVLAAESALESAAQKYGQEQVAPKVAVQPKVIDPTTGHTDEGFLSSLGRAFDFFDYGKGKLPEPSGVNVPVRPGEEVTLDKEIERYRQSHPVDYAGIRKKFYTEDGKERLVDYKPEDIVIPKPETYAAKRIPKTAKEIETEKRNILSGATGLTGAQLLDLDKYGKGKTTSFKDLLSAQKYKDTQAEKKEDAQGYIQLADKYGIDIPAGSTDSYIKKLVDAKLKKQSKFKSDKGYNVLSKAVAGVMDANAAIEMWDSMVTNDKDEFPAKISMWKKSGYKDSEIAGAINASKDDENHVDLDDVSNYLKNVFK